jgi:transposase
MKKTVIGIDISKKTLDWCVINGKDVVCVINTKNDMDSIVSSMEAILKDYRIDIRDVLVCAEYTGRYIYPLTLACLKCGADLWLESGYNIKCEARKERGKSDRADAFRIAEYGRKNQDDSRIYRMPAESISNLRYLFSEREIYNSQRAALKAQIHDMQGYMPMSAYSECAARELSVIRLLDSLIAEIDNKLEDTISSDPELRRQYKLLQTIPGVGALCAATLIAVTAGFTIFENGRELCCFAGLAPFSYSSGTSIRSRNRVSHRANHHLKALLHLCAISSATRAKDNPFADYYRRKVDEGKNKMSVLNAVRAKMVLTAFAMIRDNTPFDKNHKLDLHVS